MKIKNAKQTLPFRISRPQDYPDSAQLSFQFIQDHSEQSGIEWGEMGSPVNPHRWKTFPQSSVFSHQSILSLTEPATAAESVSSCIKPCMALRPNHIIVSSSSKTPLKTPLKYRWTFSSNDSWAESHCIGKVVARNGSKCHSTGGAEVSLCPPGSWAALPLVALLRSRTTERESRCRRTAVNRLGCN